MSIDGPHGGHERKATRGEARATFDHLMTIETDDCVLWPHAVSVGYGSLALPGLRRQVHVHRLALRIATGETGEGLDAAHSCRNRTCMNVRHLSWKTRAGNEADKIRDGVSNNGERNGQAKLTVADVRSVRRMDSLGLNSTEIAPLFNVHPRTIRDITNRITWRSVEP